MADKKNHVERGGEVHADTPDKWSEDDVARQERGVPKGTDTPATTDAETMEREKGKRTTM